MLDLDPDEHVVIDPRYFRAAEVDYLLGDPTRIRRKLGWCPRRVDALVERMVRHDLKRAERE